MPGIKKKSTLNETSFWEDRRIINKFDDISKKLSAVFPDEDINNRQLASLSGQLVKWMDLNFGLGAPDELRNSFTKLPAPLFTDFRENGSLYHILEMCFKFKAKCGWKKYDFTSQPRFDNHLNLLRMIQETMFAMRFMQKKYIFLDTSIFPLEEASQMLAIIKKLAGAELVSNITSATHVIIPDTEEVKNQTTEEIKVIEKDGLKYNHLKYQPESYNELIPADKEVIGEIQGNKQVWTVYARYLRDSAKYNEWMNEIDYDPNPPAPLTASSNEHIANTQGVTDKSSQPTSSSNRKKKKTLDKKRSSDEAEIATDGEGDSKKQKLEDESEMVTSSLGFSSIDEQNLNNLQSTAVIVPSHSSWFNIDDIHEIERRGLPEFFDGKHPGKTPEIYKKYRNFMINSYRKDPSTYLTATECRKFLTGDVCAIMKVHTFLEHWGLINFGIDPRNRPFSQLNALAAPGNVETIYQDYTRSEPQLPTEKLVMFSQTSKLPQRTSSSQQPQSDWTDEETLRLFDAISKYKDNWTAIAAHVKTRTKEECIMHFIQLPIEDQFLQESDGPVNSASAKSGDSKNLQEQPLPFADAGNPVMSLVAFLSSMVNTSVASAAAQAALEAMNKEGNIKDIDENFDVNKLDLKTASAVALGAAAARAKKIVEHEEREIQKLVAFVVEKQLKKLEVKIRHFERLEETMLKERQALQKAQRDLFEEKQAFMKQLEEQGFKPNKM
jgi:SWI/SNF related-matrix-associated actin-dependent regulator of chromatin subfamily C